MSETTLGRTLPFPPPELAVPHLDLLQLRMVEKLKVVIASLQLVETDIGKLYAEGVVDGFSDQSAAYYCALIVVRASVPRSEELLREKYKAATTQSTSILLF